MDSGSWGRPPTGQIAVNRNSTDENGSEEVQTWDEDAPAAKEARQSLWKVFWDTHDLYMSAEEQLILWRRSSNIPPALTSIILPMWLFLNSSSISRRSRKKNHHLLLEEKGKADRGRICSRKLLNPKV